MTLNRFILAGSMFYIDPYYSLVLVLVLVAGNSLVIKGVRTSTKAHIHTTSVGQGAHGSLHTSDVTTYVSIMLNPDLPHRDSKSYPLSITQHKGH